MTTTMQLATYRFVVSYPDGTRDDVFVEAGTLRGAWAIALTREMEGWDEDDLHEGILKMQFDSRVELLDTL